MGSWTGRRRRGAWAPWARRLPTAGGGRAAILLGPVVVVAALCVVLVLCVDRAERPQAIASLTPVLIAAVTWRAKDGRGRKKEKAAPGSAKKELPRK